MTAPAETLRAAAQLLRETAAEATPGPWTVMRRYSRKHPELMVGADLITPKRTRGISLKYGELPDYQWTALVHPGIAESFAAWFEDAASTYELYVEQHSAEIAERVVWFALAAADALLGQNGGA